LLAHNLLRKSVSILRDHAQSGNPSLRRICIERFGRPSRDLAQTRFAIGRIGPENESPRPRGQLPCDSRLWFSRPFTDRRAKFPWNRDAPQDTRSQKTLISP
jgi:hypothetical protein